VHRGPLLRSVRAEDSQDPLTHVGSVEAPNPALAQVRAWYVYDQHHWLEMCVVPTAAIVPLRPGGVAGLGGGGADGGQTVIKAV
jgi:hypothetical protein